MQLTITIDAPDDRAFAFCRALADILQGPVQSPVQSPVADVPVLPPASAPAEEPEAAKPRRARRAEAAAAPTEAPVEAPAPLVEPDASPSDLRALMTRVVGAHGGSTAPLEATFKAHGIKRASELDTPAKRLAFKASLEQALQAGSKGAPS